MTQTPSSRTTIRRSYDERIFAGVAGGLGEHFGIDPWWFRWAFIILSFFGLAGVFLYIVGWALLPKERDDGSLGASWVDGIDFSDVGAVFGVLLLALAGIIVLTQVADVSGSLIAATALTIIGVLLYRGDIHLPRSADDAEPSDDEGGMAGAAPFLEASTAAPAMVKKKERRPKPRRERSMLGRLTMAVVLIAIAVMALADVAGWVGFQPVAYPVVALAIVGGGLIVGTWLGRARWLVLVGLLVMPLVAIAGVLPEIATWTVGSVEHRVQTLEQASGPHELAVGHLVIDLTDLQPDELDRIGEIDASVGVGQLVVKVPIGTGVVVNANVKAGYLSTYVMPVENYVPLSSEDAAALEECLMTAIDPEHCSSVVVVPDTQDDRWGGAYPWEAFRYDTGLGMDEVLELGVEPYSLELDLSVGVGEIAIEQIAESTFHETVRKIGVDE